MRWPFVVALGLMLWVPTARAVDRPNFLWISCEDISPQLGCYGCREATTPTLDRLAARGVRYTHAFTTCPVCATNRSSIITGIYPTTIGTHYMRCQAQLPPQIHCFPEYLRRAGYYCTNNVKTDYNFQPPDSVWDESSKRAHWRGRRPGQPFFAVFNFTVTHESSNWPRGQAHLRRNPDVKPRERHDPARVTLPPYYCDTPQTRRDWANYLDNITQLDYEVAKLLAQLEQDNLQEKTIVFFWSDHGAGLPRAKRWLYDSGTRIPLIVVIPERFRPAGQGQPGTVTDELVGTVDLAPTMLTLAGLKIPAHMQGRAFLGTDLTAPRRYVFGTRDRMDERYDMIRSVRDGRYRYIRNFMPWKPYAQYLNYAERNETMKALRTAQREGSLPPAAEMFMAARKPAEELYDSLNDPHEIHNLAGDSDAAHRRALQRLRGALSDWMTQTADLGLIPEPLLVQAESQLGNRPALLKQPGAEQLMGHLRALTAPPTPHETAQDRLARATAGVGSDQPAERYWSVLLLADRFLQQDPPPSPDAVAVQLEACLSDSAAVVRVAAADALCRLGKQQTALPVLIAELQSTNPWIRLQAAIALDELDEVARPATPLLEKAIHDQNNYVARVAERALQLLLDRQPQDL